MTPKEALKPIKEIVRLFTKKAEIENFDDEFNLIEQALNDLERAKKVEELLELYRKHINNLCKIQREGVKNSLFSSEFVAYELYEKIKALEEELK